jgi:predicted oxidoreductase
MISNKVTHLITTIERGGAEKQLLTLASEQVQSGLKVEVFFLKGKPDLKNEFEESGVEVNNLLVGKSFLKQIFLLSKHLRKNPSPVHAHLPKSELLASIVVQKNILFFLVITLNRFGQVAQELFPTYFQNMFVKEHLRVLQYQMQSRVI